MQKALMILLGISLLTHSSNGFGQTPNPLFAPGTQLTVGDRKLPDPLHPYDQLIDTTLAAKSPIKETEGCKLLSVWEPVVVPRMHWRSIAPISSPDAIGVGVLGIVANSNCVKVGYPSQIAEVHPKSGVVTYLGWFLATSIVARRPSLTASENQILISSGLLGSNLPIVFVSGRIIANHGATEPGMVVPRMAGVRMLSREQMESAVLAGESIVDVRPKLQFDLVRVKGSVNVPYTTKRERFYENDEYANFAKEGDAFDIRRVNQDRQKPVILIGENPTRYEVFRAAVVLRSEGWKKVFVFYEGTNYFTGMTSSLPITSNLVGLVGDAWTLGNVRLDKTLGAQLVDVRNEAEFKRGSISGAISVPMNERLDLKLRRPGLNGKKLIEYGDSWNPPAKLSKTAPLVVFGWGGGDWAAYKAALIARAMGFKAVHWFAPGLSGWETLSKVDPDRFPMVSSGQSGDLKK